MHSFIPPNIDQSGYVFYGMIKTRNAIEAIVFGIPTYFLVGAILSLFLPYAIKLAITLILTMAVAFFFAYGLDDKSIITALMDRYRFRSRKSKVTLGVPMAETIAKKSFLRKNQKGDI